MNPTPQLVQETQKIIELLSTELGEQLESSITNAVEQLRAVKGDEQLEKAIVESLETKLGDLVGAWSQYSATVSTEYLELMNQETGAYEGQPLYTYNAGEYITNLDKIASIYSHQPASYWDNLSGENRKKLVARLRAESLQTGNNFIAHIASRTGERCAIVTRGKTCAFCTMLASRGYVYHVQHMPHLHDDCDCVLMPQSYGEHIGYDYSEAWHQYYVARTLWDVDKSKSPTDNEITQLMRHLYREKYTDITTTPVKVKQYGDGTLSEVAYSRFLRATTEKYLQLKKSGALPDNAKLPPLTPYMVPEKLTKALEEKGLKLTTKQWNHILVGSYNKKDRKNKPFGGGHLYGHGWKAIEETEFTKKVTPEKVCEIILQTLTGEKMQLKNTVKYVKKIDGEIYELHMRGPKIITIYTRE